jgi:hypothetical protein
MLQEHLIYKAESAFGTWALPDKWLRVDEANVQSARESVKLRTTGMGRDLTLVVPGAKPVNGPIRMPWWFTGIGTLLRSFMRDEAVTNVIAGVDDHGLLFDDNLALQSVSMQQQHSASVARNVLGGVVSKATFSFIPKDAVRLALDLEAKDDSVAGATWDFDGSASPAVITPAAYPALDRPFMFYDVTVTIGGTPAFNDTTNKLSISGGTVHKLLKKVEIAIDNGVDTDGFGLAAPDPTRQDIAPGDRMTSVSIDRNWADLDVTLSNNWRAGTAFALGLDVIGKVITGGNKYELHLVVPALILDAAQHPALAGGQGQRTQTATGEATGHPTLGKSFGLWIRTSEATF